MVYYVSFVINFRLRKTQAEHIGGKIVKKKRTLTILLAGVMALSLAACGGSGGDSGSSSDAYSSSDSYGSSSGYSSSDSYGSSGGYSSSDSYSSSGTGAGGYDMPNESDESFSDYVQRVDPELYNDMTERYDSLTD